MRAFSRVLMRLKRSELLRLNQQAESTMIFEYVEHIQLNMFMNIIKEFVEKIYFTFICFLSDDFARLKLHATLKSESSRELSMEQRSELKVEKIALRLIEVNASSFFTSTEMCRREESFDTCKKSFCIRRWRGDLRLHFFSSSLASPAILFSRGDLVLTV